MTCISSLEFLHPELGASLFHEVERPYLGTKSVVWCSAGQIKIFSSREESHHNIKHGFLSPLELFAAAQPVMEQVTKVESEVLLKNLGIELTDL